MKNFEYVGTWWANGNTQLVKINNRVYALSGWNGEKYLDCWKCLGSQLMDESKEVYVIEPIYGQVGDEEDEELEIVEYRVDEDTHKTYIQSRDLTSYKLEYESGNYSILNSKSEEELLEYVKRFGRGKDRVKRVYELNKYYEIVKEVEEFTEEDTKE